ncbi:MAG: hypothetical protein HON53_24045 [Planctomycetaceae bacterium]|nr:hypothetical protein [Planctomycetaceae bacterium]MBT6153555.1 hypothetical protein [Planctomycetaceae bacterium]MBT6483064.1 hypothetical protein [Planctomycetaceae bacterium]MBT6495387.1 hypothetical protein [Planctomycetaceae bacterium]
MTLLPDGPFDAVRHFKWGVGIATFGCLSLGVALMVYRFGGPKLPSDYWGFLAYTLLASFLLAVACSVVAVVFLVSSLRGGQLEKLLSILAIFAITIFWIMIQQIEPVTPGV